MIQIDLNADLGEGYGPWTYKVLRTQHRLVSSANVACGFHAGDPAIMDRTAREALARNVDLGAHVGFPDRQGFGRRVMQVDAAELASMVVYQLGALAGIARRAGHRVTHMSFHGALGNMAAADVTLAEPLVQAVAEFDPALIVLTSASRAIEHAAAQRGLPVARCFLADRAYDTDGLLVSRKLNGAVIHDPAEVVARVRQLLTQGTVVTHGGAIIPMPCTSILLHGDTQGALQLGQAVRQAVLGAGGALVPLSRQRAP